MDALVGWILCRDYGHNAKQQLPDAAEMSGLSKALLSGGKELCLLTRRFGGE
jgi:hypothetical protein